jgi:hypothetical protein
MPAFRKTLVWHGLQVVGFIDGRLQIYRKNPRPNLLKFETYLTKRIGERVSPAPM